MDIYEIRRSNLLALIAKEKRLSIIAEKIDKPASLVSRWKLGKPIGPEIARTIESAYGQPRGWFDSLHDSDSPPALLDLYTRIVISAGYDPDVLIAVTAYFNKYYPDLSHTLPKEQYLRLIMAIAKGRKTEDPLPSADWITDMVALAKGQG